MKTPTSTRLQKGVALVIVLAFLVLITGIILAFFSGVTTERNFSKTSADAATSQQLANSAVNIVMAQIVDATKGSDTNGSTLAWASQPGMIRTYDTSGNAGSYYKLYSSDQMVVQGSGFSAGGETPASDWCSAANAGLYVDLNAPVLVSDSNGQIVSGSNKYSADYPIMDPMAEGYVDGFSMTSRPGSAVTSTGSGSVSGTYDPTQTAPAGETSNPAPMPVKWLYVLKNGKVVSPTSSGTPGVLAIPGCSLSNPVTGRVAFWTDDESCKVNINTASEGVYWDVPRIFSIEDCGKWVSDRLSDATNIPGMATSQPVQKEFQRYPGHPATTSLSAIFGNYGLPVPSPWQPWLGTFATPVSGVSQFNQYYLISPRTGSGGSNAGTALTGTDIYSGTIAESGTASFVPRRDRLYGAIDELMFSPKLTSGSSRIPNTNTSGSAVPSLITKNVLEQTKFFITANSSAPEVNLFNTPRISMWPEWDSGSILASGTIPVSSGTLARTAYDNLAAFCGTIAGSGGTNSTNTYYFTRAQARSDSYDANITRNQILYKYLQALTSQNIPGFGGNFATKYGTDRDQILTMMFDYIRCINLADSSLTASGSSYPFTPLFNITVPPSDAALDSTNPYRFDSDVQNLFPLGAGEVVPIKIGSTMGAGRFLTIAEADILFYATGTTSVGAGASKSTQVNKFRAMLLTQFASPMQGMSPMRSSLQYTITGVDGFTVTPTSSGTTITLGSAGFPSGATNYIQISDAQTGGGRSIGGVEGPAEALCALGGHAFNQAAASQPPPYDSNVKQFNTAGGAGNYPFFTPSDITFAPSILPVSGARTFAFSGGSFQITLSTQATPNNPSVTVQTMNLSFPPGTFKIPDVLTGTSTLSDTSALYWSNVANRISQTTVFANSALAGIAINTSGTVYSTIPYVVSTDTLVGIQPAGLNGITGMDSTGGDIRMIAPLSNVASVRFRANNNYYNSGVQWAHNLMTAGGNPYQTGTSITVGTQPSAYGIFGTLAGPANYYAYNHHTKYGPYIQNPYVPSYVGNAVTHSSNGGGGGDWDTGIGNALDGAYMNKPDEGDTRIWAHSNASSATVLRYPYQLGSTADEAPPGQAYFSPNRQVPSAMMFGSIPTGVQNFKPWQTLLFNPKPEDATHPGKVSPEDHLFADLFWMPVVEPYAISQPFSTAGKINLNYQIMPFTYVKRQTGLNALMKATKFAAIPLTDGTTYKPVAEDHAKDESDNGNGAYTYSNPNRRHSINISETLKACDTKFANSDIYKSATEFCDINLVPMPINGEQNWTTSDMVAFWNANKLTGDNLREKPYVDIYARLTTKSNTYTVHFYVQPIKQNTTNAIKGVFVDPGGTAGGGRDTVLSEYRGSTIIERYIDINDPALPDFAATVVSSGTAPSIDPYYKFRVVSTKRFAP